MRTAYVLALTLVSASLSAQQTPVSQGVYRLPYANGTNVFVSNSHDKHRNRLDLVGVGGGPYTIVAAARGTVRIVVDNNETICQRPPSTLNKFDTNGDGIVSSNELILAANNNTGNQSEIIAGAILACINYDGPSSSCCMRVIEPIRSCIAVGGSATATCSAGADGDGPNNYTWIEHENGEWTKYSHFRPGSSLVSVGDIVNAGQPIGLEGDVGFATGEHLHFEIAALDDVSQIGATGFAIDDDGITGVNTRHRVPVFCQLGILKDNDTITAVSCDDQCSRANRVFSENVNNQSARLVQVSNTLTTNSRVFSGSGLSLRAGNRVRVLPGFKADGASFFAATIGGCDRPGGIGE